MMEYSKYKDSGIPWVGKIPEHWNVLRGKNVLTLLERPVQEGDDIITCFRDGEVTLRKKRREEGFTVSMKEIGYQGVEPGDLVVHGMDGFAGAIGVSDSRGKATPVLNVMDSKENKQYLMYYLRAAAYKDVFMSLSTGIRVRSCDLRWNKISVFPFLIPDINEQNSIVTYIDNQIKRIDDIISEAKASVEEYKSWKASIIYEAVTKGVNPNAEMKDSGIEWIGFVPSHWRKKRIRDYYKFEKGKNAALYTKEYIGLNYGDYPVYSGQTENGGIMGKIDTYDYDVEECLFTTTVGAKVMTPKLLHGKFSLSQNCLILIPYNECDNVFFYYSLFPLFSYAKSLIPSYMQPSLRISDLNKYSVYAPDTEEQKCISAYLDKKCARIEALIIEKQMLISDLEAYKKSLIFEVVTGKRRVV